MSTQNIFDLTDTWNAGATTFTAIKMNVTDTASTTSSTLLDLQVGGTTKFKVQKDGFVTGGNYSGAGWWTATTGASGGFSLGSGHAIAWGSATSNPVTSGVAGDTILVRDAANTLALRNGTNAQAFRVYNTFTDASNYELGHLDWVGNALYVRTTAAGTGTARGLNLQAAGNLFLGSGGSSRWLVSSSTGHFLANADNTYDIGASGATRPRNLYMGSWIRMAVTTVASLPAAATAGAGARMMVSDASAPVFGSAVIGGGAVTVPVYSTGSAWNVG